MLILIVLQDTIAFFAMIDGFKNEPVKISGAT